MAADLTPATDAEIAEAERLHAAATPGEWRADTSEPDDVVVWAGPPGLGIHVANLGPPITVVGAVQPQEAADAAAIVAAHNIFPRLLARLRAAEAANAALRDEAETNAGLLAQYEAADIGKHPDAEALLKSALGPDWSRHWGPTLEALGRAVDAVLHARDAERKRAADLEGRIADAREWYAVQERRSPAPDAAAKEWHDTARFMFGALGGDELMRDHTDCGDSDRMRERGDALAEALTAFEGRYEPGTFCDHAAAPCERCFNASAALAAWREGRK